MYVESVTAVKCKSLPLASVKCHNCSTERLYLRRWRRVLSGRLEQISVPRTSLGMCTWPLDRDYATIQLPTAHYRWASDCGLCGPWTLQLPCAAAISPSGWHLTLVATGTLWWLTVEAGVGVPTMLSVETQLCSLLCALPQRHPNLLRGKSQWSGNLRPLQDDKLK